MTKMPKVPEKRDEGIGLGGTGNYEIVAVFIQLVTAAAWQLRMNLSESFLPTYLLTYRPIYIPTYLPTHLRRQVPPT